LTFSFGIELNFDSWWAHLNDANSQEILKKSKTMSDTKKKLLFVCTVNRMRSATAHKVYETDARFEVKSAGTDKSASTVLTEELLNWAESVVVMEKHHRNHIRKHFPDIYINKRIVCLYIPDDYDYMQTELISILKDKLEDVYHRKLI
jgi:predicted protein tyrosine phosphatase